MGLRIKGQETNIFLVVDGALLDTLTDVKNSEFTIESDILEENYQGKTSPDFDEIFKGVSGKIDYHFGDDAIFTLMQSVVDRAKRQTPGVQINVQSTFNLPNGVSKRVIIPNCSFGPIPMTTGGRSEYVSTSLTFKASDFKFL